MNVKIPKMGDNKAILRPPAIIAGFASPVASSTSNAPIKPRKADKNQGISLMYRYH